MFDSMLIHQTRYMSYFFELAGMSNMNAFNLSVGLTGCMVVGCMIGWVLVERLGRRTTVLLGKRVFMSLLPSEDNSDHDVYQGVPFLLPLYSSLAAWHRSTTPRHCGPQQP